MSVLLEVHLGGRRETGNRLHVHLAEPANEKREALEENEARLLQELPVQVRHGELALSRMREDSTARRDGRNGTGPHPEHRNHDEPAGQEQQAPDSQLKLPRQE